ncbi:MAG: helix-turn-helix domain-containing protein [Actinomycetota bacterium]|nr:helix-turn-helix domain-containing protein [Actinomycetota bacterium]
MVDEDWQRLGHMLREARLVARLRQSDVGTAIGVKRGALANIEAGAISKITPTIRAYAKQVGWADGSIEAVLAGRQPTLTPHSEDTGVTSDGVGTPLPSRADALEDLPWRIRAALTEGSLIDSAVIELPAEDGEDPDARMVVVVKGKRQLNPEQLKRALLQWEKAEEQLRRGDGSG